MAARPLSELIAPDWAQALAPVEETITELGSFLRAEIAAGRSYLPAGDNILRAFRQPLADVRVLIVGQDPYPTPGHPVGLSFSVAPDVLRLPGSLVNIFKEYTADLGHPRPTTGDLTPWSERGVMLLNRVLTVQPGKPGSHRGKGWEQVTEQAIRALAARGGPLVAILWGNDARNLAPLLGSTPSIQSAHPSPMSADRGFFGSRPFSRADALLSQQGSGPVDWKSALVRLIAGCGFDDRGCGQQQGLAAGGTDELEARGESVGTRDRDRYGGIAGEVDWVREDRDRLASRVC